MYLRTILLFLICAGCGQGFEEDQDIEFETYSENYAAVVKPINRYGRSAKASLKISIADNQLWARVFYFGNYSDNSFIQLIHEGHSCPSSANDTNQDGHIDFSEIVAGSGRILLPLDSNLSTRFRGIAKFPQSRKNGKYYYSESTNFEFMVKEMTDPMEDFILPFASLTDLNDFYLEGRVFIIYGIGANTRLPRTFIGFDGYREQDLYPILCGQITRE